MANSVEKHNVMTGCNRHLTCCPSYGAADEVQSMYLKAFPCVRGKGPGILRDKNPPRK